MGITRTASRSQVLRGQSCPRAEFLEYQAYNGTPVPGVVLSRLNSDLVIGSGFHTGVEALLSGASEDEAVGRALEGDGGHWPGFWPLVKSKGLILGDNDDADLTYHEQGSLIEALVRGYNRFSLPQLLERFDVVEVEREGKAEWTDGDFTLVWAYRADALLLEKDTLVLYVLSLKTAKDFGKKKADQGTRDMQGLSEVAAIDQRLQRWDNAIKLAIQTGHEIKLGAGFNYKNEPIPDWFLSRHLEGASPSCFGVKMEYALKGLKLEEPKGSGRWRYSNALIRPWKYAEDLGPTRGRRRGLGSGDQYAISYDFKDDLGGSHRLGKGWTRINIWEDMGVKDWMDYVEETPIQGFAPGHAIAAQFALPEDYYRNDDDIERWKRRMLFAERRKALGLVSIGEALSAGDYAEFEDRLDEFFPPHSNSCDYPSKCVYQDICYSANKGYLFNPMSAGIYEPRTPNHPEEKKE